MEYTLDELVATVAARLAAAGLDRQVNGQVSAFPDRRTLRYYTTIGLMDRPDSVRGRQAIYGDRHVAQAVAVKRLQASGLALAAIQARLGGLPPAEVEAVASGRSVRGRDGRASASPRRFWAELAPGSADGVVPVAPQAASASAPAAWSASPAMIPAPPAPPAPPVQFQVQAASPDALARPMLAITLAADATLLLATDRPLTPTHISDIRAAAADLLDYLDHLSAAGQTGAANNRKDRR